MKTEYKGGYFIINGLQSNIEVSNFACNCCGLISVDTDLITKIIKFENELGKKIKISNSTRCKKHNAQVGGSAKSTHLEISTAIDFEVEGLTIDEVIMTAREIFGGIGAYYNLSNKHIFYHVDTRAKKLLWHKVKKYVYFDFKDYEKLIDGFKAEIEKINEVKK